MPVALHTPLPSPNQALADFELCWSIREFEKQLLDLFSKGLVTGTTHTCWGQEVSAVGVIKSLPASTTIFSNHRSHGHFLAATEDYTGLLHEILGHESGINFGIGGSQHLCVPGRFYSNGVLGGTIAMACGYAWGKTRLGENGLSAVFLGDGGIGEGACYESFNMAKLRNLPVIFVVENNDIAQSTDTVTTTAGTLEGRFAAFNIPVTRVSDGKMESIKIETLKAAQICAAGKGPVALILDIPRLGPHSKGDDTRDAQSMAALSERDPLKLMEDALDPESAEEIKLEVAERIKAIYDEAALPTHAPALGKFSRDWHEVLTAIDLPAEQGPISTEGMGSRINCWLLSAMESTPNMVFLGEDLLDPYGGAFKIAKGLSTKFPDRVWSTPISEQAITGFAGGASLAGAVPVAEIMFGDFITLACDAIVNYLSKFRLMYGRVVETPAIIRTAVGAGRGYGATHSQSLERMLAGIPGLHIEAPNPVFALERIYRRAASRPHPTFMIEHKTDYPLKFAPTENQNVFADFRFERQMPGDEEIVCASLTDDSPNVIVAYGGMIKEAMKTAKNLLIEHEIAADVIAFHKLQPLSRFPEYLKPYQNVFLMEEGPSLFGIMSEYEAHIRAAYPDKTVHRLAGKNTIIPNSKAIENQVVMNAEQALALIPALLED